MKKLIIVLCILLLTGCIITKESVDKWFNLKKGNTQFNITGKYDSGNMMAGGWGTLRVVQEGNSVMGTLGFYQVKGVLNRDKVYLSLHDANTGKIHYTCILTIQTAHSINGTCYHNVIAESKEAENSTIYSLFLNKI